MLGSGCGFGRPCDGRKGSLVCVAGRDPHGQSNSHVFFCFLSLLLLLIHLSLENPLVAYRACTVRLLDFFPNSPGFFNLIRRDIGRGSFWRWDVGSRPLTTMRCEPLTNNPLAIASLITKLPSLQSDDFRSPPLIPSVPFRQPLDQVTWRK